MKVLTIGSDKNLFVENSEAQKRIKDYGKLFEGLHIIVFANAKLGYENINLENNIAIYPTNSRFKLLYLWDAYWIAKKIIRNWGLGIRDCAVSAQDPFESGLAGWLVKLKYQLPLQIQIHTDVFSPYFWQESWQNKIRVWLAKFLLPRADSVRVVSERIKQSLLTLYLKLSTPNSITVLPIFVDVKKNQSARIKTDLRKKYPDYDFRILIASRLTREKNIGLAIKAMTEVVKKYPRTLLLIVGDGPEEKKLRAMSYELRANIILEPWTDDLISYYKTADLFLLTSNYEGYGRTIVEAMAAGLPVIMTDVGLAGELLIDDLDGIVIPVRDQSVLENAILNLMASPEKPEEFRNNSFKALTNFIGKDEYLRQYKLALESLLKNGNNR